MPHLVDKNEDSDGDRKRDLALFNLAIDSKLRACDVVALRVVDVAPSGYAMDRATTIRRKKTGMPVRFELTDHSRRHSITKVEPMPTRRSRHGFVPQETFLAAGIVHVPSRMVG